MHYGRWETHGDPLKVDYATGERHGQWRDGSDAYNTAHNAVRKARGKASAHPCVLCGGKARDWAYDHSDPDEVLCPKKNLIYSTDPERYRPMCPACHQTYDREHQPTRRPPSTLLHLQVRGVPLSGSWDRAVHGPRRA